MSKITLKRLSRGTGAAAMLLATVSAFPSASGAQTTELSTTEYVVGVSQPAIVALETTVHVWIADEAGNDLNDGYSYPVGFTCSGFVVSQDGGIVTAAHCVDTGDAASLALAQFVAAESGLWTWGDEGDVMSDAELSDYAAGNFFFTGANEDGSFKPEIMVYLSSESGGDVLPARVLESSSIDGGTDVAVLRVLATGLPTVELSTDVPTVGEAVVSAGYPGSTEAVTDIQSAPSFTQGAVTSVRTREGGLVPVYEIDAGMAAGMSGGPTLNAEGEVIGLNSFGARGEATDLGFISPSTMILEMVNRNGLDLAQTGTNLAYHEAMAAYFGGDLMAAAQGLKSVVVGQPNHALAQHYLDLAEAIGVEAAEASGPLTEGVNGAISEQTDGAQTASSPMVDIQTTSADVGLNVEQAKSESPGSIYETIGRLGIFGTVLAGAGLSLSRVVARKRGNRSNATQQHPDHDAFAAYPAPAATTIVSMAQPQPEGPRLAGGGVIDLATPTLPVQPLQPVA